jgi:hypothetical protein
MPIGSTRHSQPPSDEGSRKKLGDRKGNVEKVEKAYVGIVNVYQLIPKGHKPAVSRSKALEIVSERKKEVPKIIGDDYAWKYDSHAKGDVLIRRENGIETGTIEDVNSYDAILSRHPSLVKTPSQHQINTAVQKVNRGKDSFRQARNIGIKHSTLMAYVKKNTLDLDKIHEKSEAVKRKEELDKQGIEIKPITRKQPTETVVVKKESKKSLPVDISKLRRISISESNNSEQYTHLTNEQQIENLYRKYPSSVVYVDKGNGDIEYYAEVVQLRRKHISLPKIGRRKMVFRVRKKLCACPPKRGSKSRAMKKAMLKKLRCKCKPRRK